ncbi:hypothetical protein K9863_08490, partial [Lactobacillaceae bacterium KNUT 0156]|nr:hypothetical protein [Weissella cibaria]
IDVNGCDDYTNKCLFVANVIDVFLLLARDSFSRSKFIRILKAPYWRFYFVGVGHEKRKAK